MPEVAKRNNPLVTIVPPLSIPGTDPLYGLDICLQVVELVFEVHPGGVSLPLRRGK